jgi:hypothetical protein
MEWWETQFLGLFGAEAVRYQETAWTGRSTLQPAGRPALEFHASRVENTGAGLLQNRTSLGIFSEPKRGTPAECGIRMRKTLCDGRIAFKKAASVWLIFYIDRRLIPGVSICHLRRRNPLEIQSIPGHLPPFVHRVPSGGATRGG